MKKSDKILGYGPAAWSLWTNGHREVSWPLALKLEREFPEKTATQWKYAKLTDVKKVFSALKKAAT